MRFMVILVLSLAAAVIRAAEGPVVFPYDAGPNVINVRNAPFLAKGDGTNDDTRAISAAISGKGNRTVYFPDGTYLVSARLAAAGGLDLVGQSRTGVVLRLQDRVDAFADPEGVVPFIYLSGSAGSICNLSIQTGSGNPAATGLRLMTAQHGLVRSVSIDAADAGGKTGLEFSPDTGGPASGACLVKDVKVSGFTTGISIEGQGNSVVIENVELENIDGCGVYNAGACVAVKGLRTRMPATAVGNATAGAVMSLLDCNFEGLQESDNVPAVFNAGTLYARNIADKGYGEAIQNSSGDDAGDTGEIIREWISTTNARTADSFLSLNLDVKDAPEPPWRGLDQWISVTQFPPVEVSITSYGRARKILDYTHSLQKAIDSGKAVVYFPTGVKDYFIGGTVHIRGKVERILGFKAGFFQSHKGSGEALRGSLIVDEGSQPVVTLEGFDWSGCNIDIEHYDRTLILRNITGGRYTAQEGAKVLFVENVDTEPMFFVKGERVWARQLHVDSTLETKIVNNGAKLWIMGMKADNWSTLVATRSGGITELLGGVAHARTLRPKEPMFIIEKDSALSICAFGEWATVRNDLPYKDLVVRDSRKPVPLLSRGDVPLRAGKGHATEETAGSVIPLFSVRK